MALSMVMTKRQTTSLAVLFLLVAVVPVSAGDEPVLVATGHITAGTLVTMGETGPATFSFDGAALAGWTLDTATTDATGAGYNVWFAFEDGNGDALQSGCPGLVVGIDEDPPGFSVGPAEAGPCQAPVGTARVYVHAMYGADLDVAVYGTPPPFPPGGGGPLAQGEIVVGTAFLTVTVEADDEEVLRVGGVIEADLESAGGATLTTQTTDRSGLGFDILVRFYDGGDTLLVECNAAGAEADCAIPPGATTALVASDGGVGLRVAVYAT